MAEEEGVGQPGDATDTQPGGTQANGEDNLPQIGLITLYVKDLSFENPNAPAVYQWQAQPQINVDFNVGAQKVADDVHEVTMKIELSATAEQRSAFQVELAYAGLFGIRNVPEDELQSFLLAEAPRLIFPFARRVVADAIRDGGFPPLMLDPIDFHALYQQRMTGAGAVTGEITGQA